MSRRLVIALATVLGLLAVASAHGAIFVLLSTTTVHRGGVLRVTGDAPRMPLYALPARLYPCAQTATCTSPLHRSAAPGRPFVLLGHTRGGDSTGVSRIRLPEALRPGSYKVFVWCAQCGGSLIIAGRDASGQTLHVTR